MNTDSDSFYSHYFVSSTSHAPPIGGDEILPGERKPNAIYIPPKSTGYPRSASAIRNEKNKPNSPANTNRPTTIFQKKQKQFSILHDEKHVIDHFMGAKRAFLAAHRRKGSVISEIQQKTWKTQEKSRQWEYQREIDLLTTNIKLRDDEYLRRLNKPRPKRGEVFVAPTTGPRLVKKLPKEIQNTTYPRNHVFYFGP
ncbi:hypothetical protein M9Y10_023533 [Tritrichomonas musculus]|uniref:Uncharacterized protein n=1 Tax=Tritrichomonas musculus TaxID=1915356 RepID=A0ABR2KVK6_9EUKA